MLFPDLRSQMMSAPTIPTISSHVDNSCFATIPVNTTTTSSSGYSSEGVEAGDLMDFEYLEGWDFWVKLSAFLIFGQNLGWIGKSIMVRIVKEFQLKFKSEL